MKQEGSTVQNLAHPAQSRKRLRVFCALLASACALGEFGCATKPSPRVSLTEGMEADAVLYNGQSWLVFRFGARRYLKITPMPGGLSEDSVQSSRWLEFGSPGGTFRPVQVVEAMQGHFYLVDAGEGRLCLYDSGAQLLSTFPLPPAIGAFTPGKMEVFRGGGGAFTFLDYQTGDLQQYVDRSRGNGGMSWVLRSTVRLPIGLKGCIQDPEGAGLVCELPEGPMRLDPNLNRIQPEESFSSAARLFWDASNKRWTLAAEGAGGSTFFQFLPMQRKLMVPGSAPK